MMIMEDHLPGRMNGIAAVVVIIMMMTAADRHPIVIIVETKDAAVVTAAVIGGIEMIVEGEEVVATAGSAINGEVGAEVEAAIPGPCL